MQFCGSYNGVAVTKADNFLLWSTAVVRSPPCAFVAEFFLHKSRFVFPSKFAAIPGNQDQCQLSYTIFGKSLLSSRAKLGPSFRLVKIRTLAPLLCKSGKML